MKRSNTVLVLAGLLAACGGSNPGEDAGASDAAVPFDAGAPDAGAPDAGSPGPFEPVLVVRALGRDAVVLYGVSADGRITPAQAEVPLPGIGTHVAFGPDSADAQASYVTEIDGPRGVVAMRVSTAPLALSLESTVVFDGPGDLRHVAFTGADSSLSIRLVAKGQHELIGARRDGGTWSAETPFVFPVDWPSTVHRLPTETPSALVMRFDVRDRRLPTTVYPLDHSAAPTLGEPVSIDAIGTLLVHPGGDDAYLVTRMRGIASSRPQLGQVHHLERAADGSWSLNETVLELPSSPADAAIAPDGRALYVLVPIIEREVDPSTGEVEATLLGYGIDRVSFDETGAPAAVSAELARVDADREHHIGVLASGIVVLATSVGNGPTEHTLRAFRPEDGALVEADAVVAEGLLRVATP